MIFHNFSLAQFLNLAARCANRSHTVKLSIIFPARSANLPSILARLVSSIFLLHHIAIHKFIDISRACKYPLPLYHFILQRNIQKTVTFFKLTLHIKDFSGNRPN